MTIKTSDTEYQESRLQAVNRIDSESGTKYEIQFEDHGGWLVIDDPGFEPEPGMVTRAYGRGFGYTVRGLDIDGKEVYYRTEEEDRRQLKESLDRAERERKEALEAKGGVEPAPGTGRYAWREGMGEISGFGDTYEAACRAMLIRTLDFWDEMEFWMDEWFNPRYHGFEGFYGLCLDDNPDAKRLDEAMMDAEIVYGDGSRERVGDGASGAMHQAVVSHAFFVRRNGWERYVEEMSKRAEEGSE